MSETNLPPKVQRRRDELRKDVHGDAEAASDPSKNMGNIASICWREGFDSCYTEYVEPLVKTLNTISKNKTEDREIYTMGCDCDELASTTLAKLGLDDGGNDD